MDKEDASTLTVTEYCVTYLTMYDMVILATKKSGIGIGLLNGYGGKVEAEEVPVNTALRECLEEACTEISPFHIMKVAEVLRHTHEIDATITTRKIHAFITNYWTGGAKETAEMGPPEYFRTSDLPFSRMMQGDRLWLPLILLPNKKKIRVIVHYGPDQKELWEPELVKVTEDAKFDWYAN